MLLNDTSNFSTINMAFKPHNNSTKYFTTQYLAQIQKHSLVIRIHNLHTSASKVPLGSLHLLLSLS